MNEKEIIHRNGRMLAGGIVLGIAIGLALANAITNVLQVVSLPRWADTLQLFLLVAGIAVIKSGVNNSTEGDQIKKNIRIIPIVIVVIVLALWVVVRFF